MAEQRVEQLGFVERLKRHHMFQIAAGYATVAYFLILVANAVFPDIGLSRGEVRYVIAILALGFPLALVFGWLLIKPAEVDAEWHSRWQRLRWRIAPIVAGPAVALVTVSGIYLWHLNGRLGDGEAADSTVAQAVAVLPFDHSADVDDSFMQGLSDQINSGFANIGVRLIAKDSSPTLSSAKTPIAAIANATGATLVIRGSVRRDPVKPYYEVYLELISATDGVTLDSLRDWYPVKADPFAIQVSIASSVAERVHFLGVLDHYFAPGYPTTKDAGALQLFRRGMMTYMNNDYVDGMQMLRASVKLDPGFAQAHAYIAYFEAVNPEPGLADPKPLVDQEIAAAEKRVPGLPEAALARAASQYEIEGDAVAAGRTLQPVAEALSNSFNGHMFQASLYKGTNHPQEAQREYQAAAALDPYSFLAAHHAAKVGLALRDYAGTKDYLDTVVDRLPLLPMLRFDLAQTEFSETGDLGKFAQAVDGDFTPYGVGPGWPPLVLDRVEAAHFAGRHAEALQGLKSLTIHSPGACPDEVFLFPQPSIPAICVAPFMAETLRLMGKDQDAAALAKLHAPEFSRLVREGGDVPLYTVNLALLQAFGGDRVALKTLEPMLKSMDKPVAQWTQDDGHYSLAAAVVLAWCGEQQQAVNVLTKSFDAPYGAHAALVARDPVWWPLYKNAAFIALLAARGQILARTP